MPPKKEPEKKENPRITHKEEMRSIDALASTTPIKIQVIKTLHRGKIRPEVTELLRDDHTTIIVPEEFGSTSGDETLYNRIAATTAPSNMRVGEKVYKYGEETEDEDFSVSLRRAIWRGGKKVIILDPSSGVSQDEKTRILLEHRKKALDETISDITHVTLEKPNTILTKLANPLIATAKTQRAREEGIIDNFYIRAKDILTALTAQGTAPANIVFIMGASHEKLFADLEALTQKEGDLAHVTFEPLTDGDTIVTPKYFDRCIQTALDTEGIKLSPTQNAEHKALVLQATLTTLLDTLLIPGNMDLATTPPQPLLPIKPIETRDDTGKIMKFTQLLVESFDVDELERIFLTDRATVTIYDNLTASIRERMSPGDSLRREKYRPLQEAYEEVRLETI